jgi:hypothetical protein
MMDDELMFRTAPYIPPIDPSNASDTQNFDDTFLDMEPVINDENDMDTDQEREQTDQEPTDGEDSVATPSQSRSSSAHPPSDLMDVFDGYSFKGRNSVIIDDEEDVSEEEQEGQEAEEDQDVTGPSILAELNGTAAAESIASAAHEEPGPEPKTPEARPAALPPSTPPAKRSPLAIKPELPPVDTNLKPVSVADATPRASEEIIPPTSRPPTSPVKAVAEAAAAASMGPDIHHKEHKKASAPKPHGQRSNRQRNRREKSGVPALDRSLSDAVFRKGSTPNRACSGGPGGGAGLSTALCGPNSPSPIIMERRGRTDTLPYRPAPKTFLRPQSTPSTPTRSPPSLGPLFRKTSNTTISTMQTLYTARTSLEQFSLKSKKSTFSVDSYGPSGHASTSRNARAA